jgi:hypothetical protein
MVLIVIEVTRFCDPFLAQQNMQENVQETDIPDKLIIVNCCQLPILQGKTMTAIIPVRTDFLMKVRNAGLDDQNQPVQTMIAQGGEPCRDVLRRALPGEALILASYCPFTQSGPYKEYGPIFVLANASSTPPDLTTLPMPDGAATGYLADIFVLRAYNNAEEIVDAQLASPDTTNAILDQFFSNPDVSFILVRFAAYGCYAFRLEQR